MKIRILYEEDIKNGVPHYTTVEIPDGDYVTVLEQDYQMRLADAPEGKKDKVKRCGTLQELYDRLNKETYNGWHRHDRHTLADAAPKRLDGRKGYARPVNEEDSPAGDAIELFADTSGEAARERREDYEAVCAMLRRHLKPDQAELLIAVHIEGVPKQEYAARLGITPSAVSHRLKTAEKNFRKIFPTPSSFDPSRG